jgi:glycosyltransferase involved in cell wall biosynthesis
MEPERFVSIVIPTHNRKESLLRALRSLVGQSTPAERYEVVVVDDGSTDGTGDLTWDEFPFVVRYRRQENMGAPQARNAGALCSSAPVLVFVDDDMEAAPAMIEILLQDLSALERAIVLATLVPVGGEVVGSFTDLRTRISRPPGDSHQAGPVALGGLDSPRDGAFVPFTHCMTGVLAVRREDFLALGMFQDPTGGWPNWDDVDFGYRAHLQGFRLWRSRRAVAYHHDRSRHSLEARCDRWQRASRAAVRLFQKYPELQDQIPMFRDKAPLSLSADPPRLLVRKGLRSLASSPPSVAIMRWLARALEGTGRDSHLLTLLYRWIVSACIYKGYRQGLRELGGRGG